MNSDITEQKRQIRKSVLQKRSSIDIATRRKAEAAIENAVYAHPWYAESEILLIYASVGAEVNTVAIIEKALLDGKRVFLPKVDLTRGERYMDFMEIHFVANLSPGYKEIPEPLQADTVFTTAMCSSKLLMLVPGVAFDKERNRLGYGKGFYDSFLDRFPALISRTIGICFTCQMVEKLPCQPTDCKLAEIICK